MLDKQNQNHILKLISMKPTHFLLIFLLSCSISVFGQHKKDSTIIYKEKYAHGLGIGAGCTTGFGISYKYCPRKDGFQLNFAPYFNNNKNYDEVYELYSIGFTYLHKIYRTDANNVYVYIGNHYMYRHEKYAYSNPPYNTFEKQTWNTGIGIGYEFNTKKKVVWNIMTGFARYSNDDRTALSFTAETALYYRFN
jgi:hypothetical protein